MKTVFDPSFKYTRSLETDVRKTFERVRRQQRQVRGREQATSQPEIKVTVLKLDQFKKDDPQLAQRKQALARARGDDSSDGKA
jgi:hypothetical protein